MSEVSEVSEAEWAVWRTFYAMRRQLDRALEDQLQRDAGISGPDYEILLSLFESPQRRMRSRDLSARIGWEKSRISHQVTRMENRGLVERSECEDDLRGTWIGLTTEGRRAVLGAMREHTTAIRNLFFDVLTPDELASLRAVSDRVLGAINPPLCDEAS
ncbi:DNA-binding MarR family transcriptional regulator [Cryobacterium mesophilum]|uniref:MarR family transcriptional regulator n=1 Tax=Terrimesophilobacter mesophilus TaxID=433647 RepID=A0A4R8VA79_9MICO|nr:MarR family winged helix-turn-helix transcriptional regulator [Terrimesophilobacter mesophilus]MBB5633023.1 DNA-binding MarR family transcriptional regulator [Terrimesophilobacter mesophilus]TFB79789.1 MarR family transcriptional regulator [Terrimesophilobacter mesophilus]